MTDRRRRQFVAQPVDWLPDEGRALYLRFGHAGLTAWWGFKRACQLAPVRGQLRWSTETEALALMGLTGFDLIDHRTGRRFDLEEFFQYTGRRHWTLTRRARADGVRTTRDRTEEELTPRGRATSASEAAASAPAAQPRRAAEPRPQAADRVESGRPRGGGVADEVQTRRQRGADAVHTTTHAAAVDNSETAGQRPGMRDGAAAAGAPTTSSRRQRGANDVSTRRQRLTKPQVRGQKYEPYLTSPHLPDHLGTRGGQVGETSGARDPGAAPAAPPGSRPGGEQQRPPLTLVAAAPPTPASASAPAAGEGEPLPPGGWRAALHAELERIAGRPPGWDDLPEPRRYTREQIAAELRQRGWADADLRELAEASPAGPAPPGPPAEAPELPAAAGGGEG